MPVFRALLNGRASLTDMTSLFDSVPLSRGPALVNRFMLSPLTNHQSNTDGTLSDGEHKWLEMRANGGFGLVMTCASHVQKVGQGFPGQLGCFGDQHIAGLTRIADTIRASGKVSYVQLHHAGNRSPKDLIGEAPVCPSDDAETGARALTHAEVEQLIADFVAAAVRCDKAGFDGVELHGAHGYIICQFLSSDINKRTDEFGGSLENRARVLMRIVDGVREQCRPDLQLAVRLSPERFGLLVDEIREVSSWLVASGKVDLIDMSLWDVFKEAHEPEHAGKQLLELFTSIPRGNVKLAVAGKIATPQDAQKVIDLGADIAALGRGAILHHDFPNKTKADPHFTPRTLPVAAEVLRSEGLSEPFVNYMKVWTGFVSE